MKRLQSNHLKTIVSLILGFNMALSFHPVKTSNTDNSLQIKETPEVHVQIHKRSTRVRAIASRGARLTQHESIDLYIQDVCSKYKVDPELVKSIIYHESRYNPKATNGNCVGLMQLSKRWHADRAKKLGVTNFYDPYENILVGVDYLSELFDKYKDPELVLMLYNMKHNTALRLYKQGKTSRYAKSILAMTKTLEKGE